MKVHAMINESIYLWPDSSLSIVHDYKTRQRLEEMILKKVEFIVDVQSLTQYGKGKWWRNQPRWLEWETKQA